MFDDSFIAVAGLVCGCIASYLYNKSYGERFVLIGNNYVLFEIGNLRKRVPGLALPYGVASINAVGHTPYRKENIFLNYHQNVVVGLPVRPIDIGYKSITVSSNNFSKSFTEHETIDLSGIIDKPVRYISSEYDWESD